jgi:hypothetical protein
MLLLVVSFTASAGEPETSETVGLPLTGQKAVEFLNTAEVVGKPVDFDDLAITSPRRLTLSNGTLTLRAIFKDENTQYRGTFRYADGREVDMVKDSYLHEIAAFELDRMLGLELVPPCVERKLYNRKGSLCLWIEDAMTEAKRKEKGVEPPDTTAFSEQVSNVRVFQQLIGDQDYSNIRNIMVDSEFRVYKVDSSMAFAVDSSIYKQLNPNRYTPEMLAALRALDKAKVTERLKPWLIKPQLKSLWARRDKILERADALIAEKGEDKALY